MNLVTLRRMGVLLTCALSSGLHAEELSLEITATAPPPYTAASSQDIRDRDLKLRPISDPSDIVKVTPGLYTGQHAGGGKANQYFLRGFDADHGTDIAFWLDGMPINMVSHAHGQGYTDLHFIIPELIERVQVNKGPYFTEYGDFATAGAVRMETRSLVDESQSAVEGGSFGHYRAMQILANNTSRFKPVMAAEIAGQNGPFDNPEKLQRYNLFFRSSLWDEPQSRLTLSLMSYGSGWHGSGQIPLREVLAGRLDRFGSIDPSEGGNSQRHSLSLQYRSEPRPNEEWTASAYAIQYRLALFSNFTFNLNDPVNGDQIEQDDQRWITGFNSAYRFNREALGRTWSTTFGIQSRNDQIHNELNHDKDRQRLDQRVNSDIREGSLAAYIQEDVHVLPSLRLVAGLRADYMGFDVEDKLNVSPSTATNQSGTQQASLLSPKANLIWSPRKGWDLFLNYGEGFHSNDARGIVQRVDSVTPLTKARGYELGTRAELWRRWNVAVSLWRLDLDSEIVWSGDEGTTETSGATRRYGIDAELRGQLLPWLWTDFDITRSKARFVSNAGNGDAVALAPTTTMSAGLSAQHSSGFFGSFRADHIAERPAIEDESLKAEGFTLFHLSTGYRYQHWEFTLSVQNLFNTTWREAQFANESQLASEPGPVTDIHFVPGTPRQFQGGVRYFFGA